VIGRVGTDERVTSAPLDGGESARTRPLRSIVVRKSGGSGNPKTVNPNHSPPREIRFPQTEANGSGRISPCVNRPKVYRASIHSRRVSAKPGKPADRSCLIYAADVQERLEKCFLVIHAASPHSKACDAISSNWFACAATNASHNSLSQISAWS
jgi:hypothetical protein